MFKALYFKEWREKALVFAFELGILVLLLGAGSFFREKKDVQEWLVYAALLLFFPFAALVLGAAGFETEYRQGAWAYLFSRPVGRISIWLAKGAALLSMLASLWLVFAAAWAAFPGIRGMVAEPRLFLSYAAEPGFPWWSVGLSAFFLVVSFSLAPLHERQFNILFLAVALGLCFPVAAGLIFTSKAGGFLAWFDPSRALAAFVLSLALIALAFAAASVLTLARSDFSQPRRQALTFVRWFAPFLVVAVAATAAWVRFAPAPGERYVSPLGSLQGEPYFEAGGEIFKYSAPKDRVERLIRGRMTFGFRATVGGGKIAYTSFSIRGRNDFSEELWVAGADGAGRRRIVSGGPGREAWPLEVPIQEMRLAPDGSLIAVLIANSYDKRRTQPNSPLWIVRADGSGFENCPDASGLFANPSEPAYYHVLAWTSDGQALILQRKPVRSDWTTASLWRYDLEARTARLIRENAMTASWRGSLSPDGGRLAIKYQRTPDAPWTLAALDPETLAITDDQDVTNASNLSQASWSPEGDRLAYVMRGAGPEGPGAYSLRVYSLSARRIVAEREMTRNDETARLLAPTWTSDGTAIIVFDRDTDGLRILGPELRDVDRIAPPGGMEISPYLQPVGDKLLALLGRHDSRDTLWRLDLKTRRWKKLY
jgi:hypothetical protein